jgi:iron complex transport system permease protein
MSKKHKALIILFSLIALAIVAILSISLGSVSIAIKDIIEVLSGGGANISRGIILDIRLPRIILAVLVGANLSVSGALLQSVMKNPLADPGLTGVSSGASLMAIIVMMYFPQFYAILPLAAFLGGVLSCIIIYFLAWKDGIDPIRIILAGVAVNAMLGGGTSVISLLNSEKIQGVLLWLNGSLAIRGWKEVRLILPYSIVALVLSAFCAKGANLLNLGDDAASSLGVEVNRTRILISMVAVLLAGISTAAVGIIGFVGLVVPHICRLIIGSNYKYLIPMSTILGALTLLAAEDLARTVAKPIELPVGVFMAVIGGPFFLFLMRRGKKA